MISIQQIRIIVILLIVFPPPCQFITLFIYFTYRALACPSFMKGVLHMNNDQRAHDLALAFELIRDLHPDIDITPQEFIANYEKSFQEFSDLLDE